MIKPIFLVSVRQILPVRSVEEYIDCDFHPLMVKYFRNPVFFKQCAKTIHLMLVFRASCSFRIDIHDMILISFLEPEDEIGLEIGNAILDWVIIRDVDVINGFINAAEQPPIEVLKYGDPFYVRYSSKERKKRTSLSTWMTLRM